MGIPAISPPLTNSNTLILDPAQTKKPTFHPRSFLFLIPTITAIGWGILLFPNFGLGLAVGTADFVFSAISLVVLSKTKIIKPQTDKNNEYDKHLLRSLLHVSVFGPIAEEGIFRGLVQPLLTKSVQVLIPAATVIFFGTGLSVATAVAIVATSVLFGAAHLPNRHKNAHIQAMSATVSGVVMGILAARFGIGASIAAHIANNSLASLFIAIPQSLSDQERCRARPQKKYNVSALPT
ncbi:MAG: CPBP family intramembrane glutamic endopeptidase [Rhabdochlamydiaceae bacterium]|jgi:membrane protease YdiL (CAAX protease family)